MARIDAAQTELNCVPCTATGCLCLPIRIEDGTRLLEEARAIVKRRPSLPGAWSGVDVEGTWARIHAVEVTLIGISSPVRVRAKIPAIIGDVSEVLGKDDKRLARLREYETSKTQLTPAEQQFIAQSVKAIYAGTTREYIRARSFRNILFGTTLVLTVFVGGFAFLGLFRTDVASWVQIAQSPVVTLWQVEFLGVFGAGIAGSVAIRRMRGSSTPYALLMASLLVKLPTGALTAVGGLILIRADMAGSLLTPDTLATGNTHMVAYALLFGAAQQLFTRLIDVQTQNVLDAIPPNDRSSENGRYT